MDHVRFGSKQTYMSAFTKGGHSQCTSASTLWAKSGHTVFRRSKRDCLLHCRSQPHTPNTRIGNYTSAFSTEQISEAATNHRCRPTEAVAGPVGEMHAAAYLKVSVCPETVRGKPYSFRRPVRCRLGRLTRCLQAIACIRARRRVVSLAPAARFSDSRQRRGIYRWD